MDEGARPWLELGACRLFAIRREEAYRLVTGPVTPQESKKSKTPNE